MGKPGADHDIRIRIRISLLSLHKVQRNWGRGSQNKCFLKQKLNEKRVIFKKYTQNVKELKQIYIFIYIQNVKELKQIYIFKKCRCMYVYMSTCVYYVCILVYTYVYLCIGMCSFVYVFTVQPCFPVYMYVQYVCVGVCTYVYMSLYVQ